VKAVGNQFVVWGRVPPEVTMVTIHLDGGSSIDASTGDAVDGVALRAFAASVPLGATVTDVEEHQTDGPTTHRDEDVASQLDELSDAVSAASNT
jgi:hypothetical protein